MRFSVRRGVLINVADPDLEADGADGVTEGQAGFSIPRSGIRGVFIGQQIAGP